MTSRQQQLILLTYVVGKDTLAEDLQQADVWLLCCSLELLQENIQSQQFVGCAHQTPWNQQMAQCKHARGIQDSLHNKGTRMVGGFTAWTDGKDSNSPNTNTSGAARAYTAVLVVRHRCQQHTITPEVVNTCSMTPQHAFPDWPLARSTNVSILAAVLAMASSTQKARFPRVFPFPLCTLCL